jgi:hypothetical protein
VEHESGSALRVARATGVVLLAAAEAGLTVEEYGPLEVKMAVTGSGTADKAQVEARSPRSTPQDVRGSRTRPTRSPSRSVTCRRRRCGAPRGLWEP